MFHVRSGVVVLGAAALLGAEAAGALVGRASACTFSCQTVQLMHQRPFMPGNLIRFEIMPDNEHVTVSLWTADGEEVPASERLVNERRVFEAHEAIAPGTALELRYESSCDELSAAPATFQFTATEHVELEIGTMELTLLEEGVTWSVNVDEPTLFKRYSYQGPVDATAQHLLRHQVTLDGAALATSFSVHHFGLQLDDAITVFVGCNGNTSVFCGDIQVALPGVHTLRVETEILGEEDAPDPIEIEVEVSAAEAEQCQLTSPLAEDGGDDIDRDGGSDEGGRSRSQRLGADTPHASSCSAALNRAGSASTAWAMLVLALIFARRRSIT
jgi:MYXO-CTERM domain-containing protein